MSLEHSLDKKKQILLHVLADVATFQLCSKKYDKKLVKIIYKNNFFCRKLTKLSKTLLNFLYVHNLVEIIQMTDFTHFISFQISNKNDFKIHITELCSIPISMFKQTVIIVQ